jgi:hypothetical protein
MKFCRIGAMFLMFFFSASASAFKSENDSIEIFEMAGESYSTDFQLSYEKEAPESSEDGIDPEMTSVNPDEIDVSISSY